MTHDNEMQPLSLKIIGNPTLACRVGKHISPREEGIYHLFFFNK